MCCPPDRLLLVSGTSRARHILAGRCRCARSVVFASAVTVVAVSVVAVAAITIGRGSIAGVVLSVSIVGTAVAVAVVRRDEVVVLLLKLVLLIELVKLVELVLFESLVEGCGNQADERQNGNKGELVPKIYRLVMYRYVSGGRSL